MSIILPNKKHKINWLKQLEFEALLKRGILGPIRKAQAYTDLARHAVCSTLRTRLGPILNPLSRDTAASRAQPRDWQRTRPDSDPGIPAPFPPRRPDYYEGPFRGKPGRRRLRAFGLGQECGA